MGGNEWKNKEWQKKKSNAYWRKRFLLETKERLTKYMTQKRDQGIRQNLVNREENVRNRKRKNAK